MSEASQTGPTRAEATELSAPADVEIRIGADAPLDHVMATMRAMRRLRPDPVPDELLDELVRAATFAPSGSDGQHYAFVVVTDREVMAQLGELWRGVVDTYRTLAGTAVPDFTDERHARMERALEHQAEHFDDTPAVVVACYRKDRPSASSMLDVRGNVELVRRLGFGRIRRLVAGLRAASNLVEASSIYPAVQNLLLAARANGLAANLTIWHMSDEHGFREVLGVPDDHGIYALVPIGWPAGRFGPVRRRPLDEIRHRNRWGS
ncbi:MAG: nitroreductase family protein [Actinomycetota bacterium]